MIQQRRGTPVRVFLSSTFRDFQSEREVLQSRVLPAVRERYARHGVAFELVDLRWGIPPAAARAHRTLDLCLKEIERCATLSPRCHFLFMLGDRYGWRPAPVVISDADHEVLASQPEAREALRVWYRQDRNAVPPVWRLRPPTADDGSWEEAERRLVAQLESAAINAGIPDSAGFGASVTETEIRKALGSGATHRSSITGVFRDLSDASAGGRDFLDVDMTGALDVDADARRRRLRADLERRLPKEAIIHFAPALAELGGGSDYLGAFATAVEQRLCRGIDDQLSTEDHARLDEASLHEGFRLRQRGMVTDRLEIIADIAGHIRPGVMSDADGPLVVAGPSGIGKTTVMAAACEAIRRRLPDARIVYRAVGATSESVTPLLLLADLCGEIARMGGRPAPGAFADDEEAAEAFLREIRQWSGPPLVVMVDALDQLLKSSPNHQYNWIPATLPDNVGMIVSAVMDRMPAHVGRRAGRILKMPYLSVDEAGRILDLWLAEAGRTLQTGQRELALRAFSKVGLPLYLRLLLELVCEWSSDETPPPPPSTLNGIIDALFDRLSDAGRSHIPELAQRAFGFLAASRSGLSYDEMQEVLSCETDLIASVARHWSDARQSGGLPPILWSRLYHDLRPLLTERLADGTVVLTIFHRAIEARMTDRFSAAERRGFASALADYFASRLLMPGGDDRGIDRRQLWERPYLLEQAGRIDDLRDCLLDHRFLDAKVRAGGVRDLVDDFARLPPDDEAAVVGGALRLSAYVLERDPAQLSGQLLGRIDPASPLCRRIFGPASAPRGVELRPDQTILASPGNSLVNIIALGKSRYAQPLLPLGTGPLVVSVDEDGAIGAWNLDSGDRVLKIAQSPDGRRWHPIAATPDGGRLVVARDDMRLDILDLDRGEVIDQLSGEGPAAVSGDGRFLVHSSPLNHVCVYDLHARSPVQCMGPAKDRIYGFAISHDGRWVISWASGFGCTEAPMLWDSASGQAAGVLKGNFYARSSENIYPSHPKRETHHALFAGHQDDVKSVLFTRDARLIISSGDEGAIVVWDRESRDQVRKLIAPRGDMIGAYLLPDERRVVSVESDGPMRFWDVETGRKLCDVAGNFSDVTRVAITGDGRRIVTLRRDGQLHVWRCDQNALDEEVTREGLGQLMVTPDGRFAVRWRSVEGRGFAPDTTLTVIDLESGRNVLALDVPAASAETIQTAATPDGRYLVRTSKRGIYVFDLVERRQVKQHSIPRKGGSVAPILSRDGLFGICGEEPGCFVIVDALSGKALHRVVQNREVSVFHPDGPFTLIDGDAGHLIQLRQAEPAELYDTRSGTMTSLDVDSGPFLNAVLLPDGKRILSTGTKSCLVLWTTQGPSVLQRLGSADSAVTALAVSSDGKRAITVHEDKSVRLWDLVSATALARLDIDHSTTNCAFVDGDRAVVLEDGGRLLRINIIGKDG
ncbi:hypothetical protein TSH100_17060 [Azospirillum sp. TSH100]|uniref:DUF4062 domain-containing protein n=1 Tax=Azospirillum sp. TSH100 TaxID=652764 RepID=UPI000D61430A|nr:DUF4062 domain-containing protein [Azospirillum sp. TSH100]PWC84723.1 hypothetical protein TSH100_17060 [Azospirillum sp. TSH100]